MKFTVNWAISGFKGLELKIGEVIEAAEDEAKHLVDCGALSLLGKVTTDTSEMSATELVAYAKKKFGYEIEPSLTKDAILAEIAALQAGTENDDPDMGAEEPGAAKPVARMNKIELVAYAKATYSFDLDPTLSKAAMVIQIESLAEQKA